MKLTKEDIIELQGILNDVLLEYEEVYNPLAEEYKTKVFELLQKLIVVGNDLN